MAMGTSSKLVEYDDFAAPTALGHAVDNAGTCFLGGAVGGWFYHFIKASLSKEHQQQPIVSRIKLSCAKSTHVGGFVGLMGTLNLGITETVNYLGGYESPYCASLIGDGCSAALMWAPKGLRSASRAALLFTSCTSLFLLYQARSESKSMALTMSDTSPYS